ncbi:hypothetical protein D9M71_428530 [compost metagenome]
MQSQTVTVRRQCPCQLFGRLRGIAGQARRAIEQLDPRAVGHLHVVDVLLRGQWRDIQNIQPEHALSIAGKGLAGECDAQRLSLACVDPGDRWGHHERSVGLLGTGLGVSPVHPGLHQGGGCPRIGQLHGDFPLVRGIDHAGSGDHHISLRRHGRQGNGNGQGSQERTGKGPAHCITTIQIAKNVRGRGPGTRLTDSRGSCRRWTSRDRRSLVRPWRSTGRSTAESRCRWRYLPSGNRYWWPG